MALPYRFVNAHEVAELIKSAPAGSKEWAVVDVRDADYIGGHIKGAIRAPSESRTDQSTNDLVKGLADVKKVIFHCTLSQVRGPKAARIYAEAAAAASSSSTPSSSSPDAVASGAQDGKTATGQEILVLRDGFQGFQSLFRKDEALIEGWRADVWGDYAP